jgi:hypothetical protein
MLSTSTSEATRVGGRAAISAATSPPHECTEQVHRRPRVGVRVDHGAQVIERPQHHARGVDRARGRPTPRWS